jgi:hypothetical protein
MDLRNRQKALTPTAVAKESLRTLHATLSVEIRRSHHFASFVRQQSGSVSAIAIFRQPMTVDLFQSSCRCISTLALG